MKRDRRVLLMGLACMFAMVGAAAQEDAANSEARSPAEIMEEIEALRVDDVPWREIQWKTCLLEGLRESNAQHKPVMLWIFIDRPFDDERC